MILNRLKHTLVCAALALGCGSSDTGTSFTDNYLSDAVDNVMPSFSAVEGLLRHKAPSAPRASTAEEWGSGNPLYEAF